MERTQEMATDAVEITNDAPEETVVPSSKRGFRILGAIMFLNVALVFALAWSTYQMGAQLETMNATLGKQVAASAAVTTHLEAITKQQALVEHEVAELRAFIASQSEEDVIYLKIVLTKREIDRTLARQIAAHVHRYAKVYGQDPDLVLAIIATESDFDPNAVSNMGALGLMQVMPQWKQVLGIRENLNEPETSIRYGLQILGFYRNMYKDLEMALTAYNRGPGPVDMALMRGKSPVNGYAPRVLQTYKELQSLQVGTKVG